MITIDSYEMYLKRRQSSEMMVNREESYAPLTPMPKYRSTDCTDPPQNT